ITSQGRATSRKTGRKMRLYVVAKPAISYLKRFLVPFLKIAAKSHTLDYLKLRHCSAEIDMFTSCFFKDCCKSWFHFLTLCLQDPSTMLAGYETSAREYVFRSLFKKASDSFDAEEYEESEGLCRLLLSYTDLSIFHKAGCHRILSLGDTDFLWHAEQALNLYEQLFYPDGESTGDHLLSDAQLETRNNILEDVHKNFAQAERDHVEIQCDYTERCERFEAIYGHHPTAKDVSKARLDRHGKRYLQAVNGPAHSYDFFIEKAFGPQQINENKNHDDQSNTEEG
ncbi:unnamed protein product, partial [Aureobasidium uvarum]